MFYLTIQHWLLRDSYLAPAASPCMIFKIQIFESKQIDELIVAIYKLYNSSFQYALCCKSVSLYCKYERWAKLLNDWRVWYHCEAKNATKLFICCQLMYKTCLIPTHFSWCMICTCLDWPPFRFLAMHSLQKVVYQTTKKKLSCIIISWLGIKQVVYIACSMCTALMKLVLHVS